MEVSYVLSAVELDDVADDMDEISDRIDVDEDFVVSRYNDQRRRSCVADFKNLNINDNALSKLLLKFEDDDKFSDLVLSSNRLDHNKCNLITNALSTNTRIVTLSLSNCFIGNTGMQIIATMFKANTSLKTIVLEQNSITEDGVDDLCKVLGKNTSLTSLNLARNQLGPIGAQKLAVALMDNCTLKEINVNKQLKGTKIGPDGATAFSRVLRRKNSPITILRMARNNIGFEGIRHISAALYKNTSLVELDIGGINYLTMAGAIVLAKALENNNVIEHVTVGEFRIPIFDIRGNNYLDKYGNWVPPVTELTLRKTTLENDQEAYAGMQDESAIVLATLLKSNGILQTLRIHHSIQESIFEIQDLRGVNLESSEDLAGVEIHENLDLSNRGYNSIDMIIVGGLIADHKYLKGIKVEGNNFARTEGENYLAFALTKNRKIKLDTESWPIDVMFRDGYKTLTSLQGASVSGVMIEPQRLEGCFYRSLTALSAVLFYISLATDANTIYTFASDPELYPSEYWIISLALFLLPTGLLSYNTMTYLMFLDLGLAIKETSVIVLQLSTFFMAWYSVVNCVETAEMLDYKFTQGIFKTIPQIAFQMYVLFKTGYVYGEFSYSILLSVMTSITSIVVIYIMLYDRIRCRRMSIMPLEKQPLCAVIIAKAYVACGMGVDDENVEGMVNFNAFYTSHYTWAYVFQLFSILSRNVSITWLLGGLAPIECTITVIYLFGSRLLLILLFDRSKPGILANMVGSIAFILSDSSFAYDNVTCTSPQRAWIMIMMLSTCENVVALAYSAFVLSENSGIPYSDGLNLFIGLVCMMVLRWVFIFHWLLPVHFHNFEDVGNVEEIVNISQKSSSKLRLKKGDNLKRRVGLGDGMLDISSNTNSV